MTETSTFDILSGGFHANPFPTLDRMRAEGPLVRMKLPIVGSTWLAVTHDNGGAIHSAERIMNLLGLCVNYLAIGHINNLPRYHKAEFSLEAEAAFKRGERVYIEHVAPLRDMTRKAIGVLDAGASDRDLLHFVKTHFRLVLLSADETRRLNKQNRSKMDPERLQLAGIKLRKLSPPRQGYSQVNSRNDYWCCKCKVRLQ